jgi:hypothetical protein
MVDSILLSQSEGAGVLLLGCPHFEFKGKKYGLTIYQHTNSAGKPSYQASITKEVKAEHYQSGKTTPYMATVQDEKYSLDNLDDLIKWLNVKFDKEFYYLPNYKILRCSVTPNEALGRPGKARILEDEALLFIAKNPHTTKKDLLFEFGGEVAEYVDRWKHDYGKETSPLIEWSDIGEGWIITPQGLAFLEDPEATY